MPLFQKSVLNKFIKSQDTVKIEAAYQRFSDIFLQVDRQSEIRSMKEEEYQDGFLDDLFVNILGYIKRPNAGFNLVREKKNEADSKKADGAILKNDSPLAVIELKGTDTTDLDKVTNQGFGYKNNHKECVYVVISNFEKLRFFIHHAVDYIEFNLFTLSKEEFTTLWLCLHSDNLLDNIPAKIKAESVVKEEDITKNLYKDYSTFKQELWQDIVKLNPNGDPLQFYKKTQKLIDRFLFIFFAEDAGLLPPNSISRMVDRWKTLKEEDAYKPLYEIFKQYFGYINTGRPGKTPQDEIFAYNGGLFLEDDVLDTVSISDEVLLKHTLKLTVYDFSSEVDVNILGHIFENSLNDIEAVTAELEGQEIDKSKTKRKKDGVFYTPKYITKYIVDNTVGKLCDEKKVELNIVDEEYAKGRTNRKKETLKILDENLQAYRNWLLNITICDPACGSGAFLNQALEYLMEEHRYIDELESQLLGAGFTFPGVENHILENNIFGVDINEESIEIAKLSLWLRTAQRGRKLTSLNNNIKCGNSLIDDPEVAGEKAFSWEKEFTTVFEKGGFDVIIGNPPYVRAESFLPIKNYLEKKYIVFNGNADLYSYFFEKALIICKEGGVISYITPNKWIQSNYGFELRVLVQKYQINSLIDFGELSIFDDAGTFPTIIFISKKKACHEFKYQEISSLIKARDLSSQNDFILIDQNNLNNTNWILKNNLISDFLRRLEKTYPSFGEIFENKFYAGIKTGANNLFIYNKNEVDQITKGDSREKFLFKKILFGQDFTKYEITNQNLKYIFFPYEFKDGKNIIIDIENYPNTFEFLIQFKDKFSNRAIIKEGIPKGTHKWFELQQINKYFDYNSPKIIYPDIAKENRFLIDSFGIIPDMTCFFIPTENPEYLSILNSKMFKFLASNYCPILGNINSGGRIRYKSSYLKKVPLPRIKSERIDKSLFYLNRRKDLIKLDFIKKFSSYFSSLYNLEKLSGKLIKWHELSFADFIKELNKAIKAVNGTVLNPSEGYKWMELFEENKKKALELKSQIDQTDKEIDSMVYELYGLTDEEIQIVEGQ